MRLLCKNFTAHEEKLVPEKDPKDIPRRKTLSRAVMAAEESGRERCV
jgi:hypothetical protein